MISVSSKRLYTRPFTTDDAGNFFALNGDPELMRYIRLAKSREQSDMFLNEVIALYDQDAYRLSLHLKEDDTFVGSFSLLPIEHTTDRHIGYAFLKKYWGQGYATEILQAGLNYVFDVMKLSSVLAIVEEDNAASIKVLAKCGFHRLRVTQDGTKTLLVFQKFAPEIN
ncbi:MAG: GNAT family N-acetyltransferase [Gemmatimonadaceae bacterium]|nr:GNAT family N-acetyltransferase [Chitinophagaceae bacterium]